MILSEYKIHNAEVLFREDSTMDEFIDVIVGNRYSNFRVAPDTELAWYPAAGYPANIFTVYPVSG